MDTEKMQALEGMVRQVDDNSPDAQAQAQAEAQAQTEAIGQAQAWAVVPKMIGKLACMVEPDLAQFYTDEACEEWGAAVVPVAEKYGWGGPGAMPEIHLAIASASFAVPTFLVLRAKLQAMKAERDKARPVDVEMTTAAPSPAASMEATGAANGS